MYFESREINNTKTILPGKPIYRQDIQIERQNNVQDTIIKGQ